MLVQPTTIRAWAFHAKKGDAMQYHRGYLPLDVVRKPGVFHVAAMVWHLYETGYVTLVQHRSGDFDYEYLAIKR